MTKVQTSVSSFPAVDGHAHEDDHRATPSLLLLRLRPRPLSARTRCARRQSTRRRFQDCARPRNSLKSRLSRCDGTWRRIATACDPAHADFSLARNRIDVAFKRGGLMKPKSPRRARRTPAVDSDSPAGNSSGKFLIAAIAASAGGVEASSELIGRLPINTGMAFVLIQHLDPTHRSMISELLSKKTKMSVSEVQDGMRVEPDHVYVIPPDATMSISDHTFGLSPRVATRGLHMPIDQFMRSLAEVQGNCAVGVILSGTGSDGTLGLAEIQAQGGVTIVQDETTAKYDGMPRSAISAGCVDLILPPPGIAQELVRLARHPYVAPPNDGGETHPHLPETPSLRLIYQLIRRWAGVDFTHYRQTTIRRRIERRMAVNKVERVEDYLRFLQSNPGAITALCQDRLCR